MSDDEQALMDGDQTVKDSLKMAESNGEAGPSRQLAQPLSQARAKRQVVLLFSHELMHVASHLPANLNRSCLVYSLLHAYQLLRPLSNEKAELKILKPRPAGREDLEQYHDAEYVRWLLHPSTSCAPTGGKRTDEEERERQQQLDSLGLTDDCPPFPLLPQYAQLVPGASLTAAAALRHGIANHAINWDGGRHHAQRGKAAGYCYVQDIVLAIQRLRAAQPGEEGRGGRRVRVMYLDLDLHLGDAVLSAFSNGRGGTLCLSIHHASPGFYPASPAAALTPGDTRDPYTISLPLARGASNATYARLWPAVERLHEAFKPEYVVVQCGLDALAGDPCRVGNWGLDRREEGSLGWVVGRILAWESEGRGTLWLGGGGYDGANAARAWTYLTSIIAGQPLEADADIPDHANFEQYAPSFTLDVPAGTMRDENTPESLDGILRVANVLADRIEQLRAT